MTLHRRLRVAIASAALILAACGGGGGDSGGGAAPTRPAAVAPTRAEAARFLRQATFGPTVAEVDRVVSIGYERWLDEQLAVPATGHLAALKASSALPDQNDRVEVWFRHAVTGRDQLRQRVAFALSQIFVVSDRSALAGFPNSLAYYYDILARNAFGNYRDLLEEVTLSPAMGVYLSMLGNQRTNGALNIRPDENYAREVMQLFTIGLVQLNADGTVRTDAQGVPLPTYDQPVVEGYAKVFTGWTFGGSASFFQPSLDFERPMQAFAALHEPGPKTLLDGTVVPAGQTPEQALDTALDTLFRHPNVGPFIGRQLIQRLVTSNPSPAYVQRVARTFDDDGRGVRGNLAAVVRAILVDPEARGAPADTSGKVTEPLLYLTAIWRAYDGRAANGRFLVPGVAFALSQGPLQSPSVFNFYRPDFAPPGEMRAAGLVAPELEITTEFTSATLANVLAGLVYGSLEENPPADRVRLDLTPHNALANDPERLVTAVAERLTGGALSPELRASIVAMVNRLPATPPEIRTAEAIYDIVTSLDYAVLR